MMRVIATLSIIIFGIGICAAQDIERITISENRHFLQYEDGSPFFYLGDTAWELFHRTTREEADLYLKDRASKGFNVIQAVALAECDGVGTPNSYGHLPLINRNPVTPDVKDGKRNDYWDHVDYIIQRANSLDMYVGLLPTWGRWWSDGDAIFTEESAEVYGRWIAERYNKYKVIWILGGDRNPGNADKQRIIRAMARGIRSVDRENLITFHPTGWQSSSEWFHNDEWLDFNARQSGHHQRYNSTSRTIDDFRRSPAKPVVDIEPLYEEHPLEFRPDEDGHSIAWDSRRAQYWAVFHGSCGITYGHHSIWQMYDKEVEGRHAINRPLISWQEALHRPGSSQVKYLKRLIESRPYFTRVSAPEFIINDEVESSVPGAGRYRFAATIDSEGSYAMVYAPVSRSFSVNGGMLKAKELIGWWYSPRSGKSLKIGKIENRDRLRFTPPYDGEALDWVLVLDAADKHYPKPGGVDRNKK